MKIFININLTLVILLSISAGLAKIMQIPEEILFFKEAGLGITILVMFGVIQLTGGILGAMKKFRKFGAVIMAVTFLFSSIMIFTRGDIKFGLFSLLPVIMSGILILKEFQTVKD